MWNKVDKEIEKEVAKVGFLSRIDIDIDKIISVFSLIALVTSTWILISKGDVAHPAWGTICFFALFSFSFAFPYYLGKKIGALIEKQTLAKLSEIPGYERGIFNLTFFSSGVGIAVLISFMLGALGVPTNLPLPTWFPIPEIPIVNSIVAFAVGYSLALYLKTLQKHYKKR